MKVSVNIDLDARNLYFDGPDWSASIKVLGLAGAMRPWPTISRKDRVIAILRLNGFEVEDRT